MTRTGPRTNADATSRKRSGQVREFRMLTDANNEVLPARPAVRLAMLAARAHLVRQRRLA